MSDVKMPSTTGRDGTVQILEEKNKRKKKMYILHSFNLSQHIGHVRLEEFWKNLDGLEECWRNL